MPQKDVTKYRFCKRQLEGTFGRIGGNILESIVSEVERSLVKLKGASYYYDRGRALEQTLTNLRDGYKAILDLKTPYSKDDLNVLVKFFGIAVNHGLDARVKEFKVRSEAKDGHNTVWVGSTEDSFDIFLKKFNSDRYNFCRNSTYIVLGLRSYRPDKNVQEWHFKMVIVPIV